MPCLFYTKYASGQWTYLITLYAAVTFTCMCKYSHLIFVYFSFEYMQQIL